MGTTSNKNLRYPSSSDAPDGPGGIFALASDVDAALAFGTDIGGTDWNTLTASGYYLGGGASSNSPSNAGGDYYYFQSITKSATGDIVQVAYQLAAPRGVFRRVRFGGTWSAWVPLYSDTGWALGSGITPATNFGALADPAGGTGSTSTVGGVRVLNGMLLGSFRLTYTGSTQTATASGNLTPDITACTLAAAYRPSVQRYIPWHALGTGMGSARINTDGTIEIVSDDPNATITNTNVLVFDFAVPQ